MVFTVGNLWDAVSGVPGTVFEVFTGSALSQHGDNRPVPSSGLRRSHAKSQMAQWLSRSKAVALASCDPDKVAKLFARQGWFLPAAAPRNLFEPACDEIN